MPESYWSRRLEKLMGVAAAPRCSPWLILALACSGGSFGTTRDRSQDGVTSPTEVQQASSPNGLTKANGPNAASRLDEHQAALATPPELRPALTDELHRLRRAAQEKLLGSECPAGIHALPYAPHAELPADAEDDGTSNVALPSGALGRFVPVENEPALERFHQALQRLAAGTDDDNKVRILAYGASHTQDDTYTSYLRAYLQSRFGDGGQGFVLIGRVNPWYRTLDTHVWDHKLRVRHAAYAATKLQDEPLGLLGAAFLSHRAGAYGEVITSKDSNNTRFELHYWAQPAGGTVRLEVDGATVALVETRSKKAGPAYHAFETTPGTHRIRAEVRGNGAVRLFGVVAETARPGIVVDTLGISGSQMASNLHWHEAAWMEAVARRKPDLVTFAYGTNEITSKSVTLPQYEEQLVAVLTRLRKAQPDVSCVLISPFDLPKVNHSRLLKVIDIQRRISKQFGCGLWDGYAFMGGERSIRRWASVKPPFASADNIHLTRLGYVYAGIAIGDALMRAYDFGQTQGAAAASVAPQSDRSL